jgi:hypothetical protein
MTMECNSNNTKTKRIVKGNSFYVNYEIYRIDDDGSKEPIVVSEIEGLKCYIKSVGFKNKEYYPDFTFDENRILIHVTPKYTPDLSDYRLVISGNYHGTDIFRNPVVFEIVQNVEQTTKCVCPSGDLSIEDINISEYIGIFVGVDVTSGVNSVNGKSGDVILNAANTPMSTIDNTTIKEKIDEVDGNVEGRIPKSAIESIVTGVGTGNISGEIYQIELSVYNPQTGESGTRVFALPPVTDASQGIMTPESYNSILSLLSRVTVLENSTGDYIGSVDTYEDLSSLSANVGDWAIVESDETHSGQRSIYFYKNSGWEYGYQDKGLQIQIANLTTAGIVLSSNTVGRVFVETNGEMSVVGWDNLVSRITQLEVSSSSMHELLTTLSSKVDENTSAISGKMSVDNIIAGDNITLQKDENGNVTISSTGGGGISPDKPIVDISMNGEWEYNGTTSGSNDLQVEDGMDVSWIGSYSWDSQEGKKDPTTTSGSFGSTLYKNSPEETFNNQSVQQKFYAPKTGYMVDENGNVVPATGNDEVTINKRLTFQSRVFYGDVESFNTSMYSILSTSKARTLTGITTQNYFVYAYPKSLGALTSIIQDGALPVLSAFNRTETTYVNQYGKSIALYVYTSGNKSAFNNANLQFI